MFSPFGWARNPIFTGMVIAAVGLSLMAPTMLTLVALLLLVVAVEVQVRSVEEPYLRTAMPDWGAYARRVGRFVPRLFGWMAHVYLFAGDDPAAIWGGEARDHMHVHGQKR